MMRYGIPAYRLPRDVLDAEIGRIVDLGVEVELGRTVSDVHQERAAGAYDAVFLAVGAQLARRIDIPAGDSSRVVDAAVPAAPGGRRRTAPARPPGRGLRGRRHRGGRGPDRPPAGGDRRRHRLPAHPARMPAHADELDAALTKGSPSGGCRPSTASPADGCVVERMEPTRTGNPEPTGEFEELDADSLVLAIGQDTDLSLLGRDAAAGRRGRRPRA